MDSVIPWLFYVIQTVVFLSYISLQSLNIGGVSADVLGRNETDRLALLEFKSMITGDPQGVLSSWNESIHFCQWFNLTTCWKLELSKGIASPKQQLHS
ncbi:hypothetical protein CRYUN_Cryun41cG0008000 [Craigia yunnanensis]